MEVEVGEEGVQKEVQTKSEVGGGPDEDREGQDGGGREEVGAVGQEAGQQAVRGGERSQHYSWKNSFETTSQ